MIDFSVLELLKQRMFALCLGYEDLNDHEQLRTDPLLAVWVGRNDPTGQDRLDRRDRGKPLAGKSTLNRMELTPRRANNQLRLWLSSVAYVLKQTLREHGLCGTPLARAQCSTIRLKLLKIDALVRVTVRRVWFSMAESDPYQALFRRVFDNLQAWCPLPPTAAPA
ncbi:MAG: transposase [Pirellulales bacterium]|nr:transposase [Pirellulales bacterium]